MVSTLNSTLSALDAMGKKMAVHANNVANVNTEGFKKSRAVLKEGPNDTVDIEVSKVNTPGSQYSETIGDQVIEMESSNVDIAEEMPQTMLTQRYYQANLKMFSAIDEMLGNLIDIVK